MNSDINNPPSPWAIILAAGKGTRMGSDKAKVLFEVAGEPMVCRVVRACVDAGVTKCIVVVGYQADAVRHALADFPQCVFVEQSEQLGTGHAAMMAQPIFENQSSRDVFVLTGDGPLIRAATLQTVLQTHREHSANATLATAVIDDPTTYGRVIRNDDGSFRAIVEEIDADEQQLAVHEVNPSYYCFFSDDLFSGLKQIDNTNRSGEYYITDVPGLLQQSGKTVVVVDAVPPEDVLSINTPEQLEQVDKILRDRLTCEQPS